MLVARWGFLRKKAPQQYTIKKTIATVSCLCSLHNFLIDNGCNQPQPPSNDDALTLAVEGGVDIQSEQEEDAGDHVLVNELTGGGEHFDDDPNYTIRRRITQMYAASDEQGAEFLLPRESMFIHVVNSQMQRPDRNLRRNQGRRV